MWIELCYIEDDLVIEKFMVAKQFMNPFAAFLLIFII